MNTSRNRVDVRITPDLLNKIENIQRITGRSRNHVINRLLMAGVASVETVVLLDSDRIPEYKKKP